MQKFLNYTIVLLTAVALFALGPTKEAMAGGAGTPSASTLFGMATADAPVQWLQNTVQGSTAPSQETFLSNFGIYNNNGGGSIQAGLMAVLSYYSYAMLVIGSFLLLYYLVRMIAETAQTGRPGGRANQLWAPIRTVIAIGLLVPLSTGLNSGQMIVLNLASEGSALASNTWSLFVQKVGASIAQGAQNAVSSPSSVSAQSQAVYNYFMTQVCVGAYNQALQQQGAFANAVAKLGIPAFNWLQTANTSSMPPSGTITAFGNGWDQTECGQMQTEQPAAITNPGGSQLQSQMSTTATGLSIAIMNAENQAWQNDVVGQMSGLPPSGVVKTYLDAVMNDQSPPASIQTALTGMIQKYNQDLFSGVQGAVQTASGAIDIALQNDAAALGWLSAGSMYMTIARLNSAISEAMMYAPSVTAPNTNKLESEITGGKVAWSAVKDATVPLLAFFTTQVPPPLEGGLIKILNAASNMVTTHGTAPTAFTLQSGQVAASAGPETDTGGLLKIVSIVGGYVEKVFPATASGTSATDTGNLPWIGNVVPTGGFPISDLATLAGC